LIIILGGCNLFSTRNPEEPDETKGTYEPPLDPETVMFNFEFSVTEMNLQNYSSCFWQNKGSTGPEYFFIPTSETAGLYPSVFSMWNYDAERKYFSSLISNITSGKNPELMLKNQEYTYKSSDSAIFQADYIITIDHSKSGIPKTFGGKLEMALYPDKSNGLWSIRRWTDNKLPSDSIEFSWSDMKAQFYN
jgi:hypothetical protein